MFDTCLVKLIKKILIIVILCKSVQCELTFTKVSKILPALIRHRRADHTYRLGNCFGSEEDAKKQYYLPTFYIMLRPEGEIFDDVPKMRQKYTWTYTVRRTHEESGKPWESFDVRKFVDSDGIIRFSPQSAPPGLYEITPEPKPKSVTKKIQMKKCYIMVKTLPPIAIIDGGAFQTVPSEETLTLNGENSQDLNVPRDQRAKLQYRWKCDLKSEPNQCQSSEKTLEISSNSLKELGDKAFQVELEVTSEFGLSNSTVQEISAYDGAAVLRVRCESNCLPATPVGNADADVVLTVTCEKNCNNILDEEYEWEIGAIRNRGLENFNYEAWTTGLRGTTFRIFKGIFLKAVSAFITVRLINANRKGQTDVHIEFGHTGPHVQQCHTQPDHAKNLKAIFTFKCQQEVEDQKYFYELYSGNTEGEMVVSGFYPEVFTLKFQLHPSSKYIVKVTQKQDIFTTDVVELISIRLKKEEAMPSRVIQYKNPYRKSANSISFLLDSGHARKREKGVNLFQSLIDNYVIPEMDDAETRKVLEEFKKSVVTDLLKPNKDAAIKELIEVSDNLQAVVEDKKLIENDPLVGNFISLICGRIASQYAETIRRNPKSMKMQAIQMGK